MIDYTGRTKGNSMFEQWERGELGTMPPPLATWCKPYRRQLLHIVHSSCSPRPASIISLGAGNGFAESEFQHSGFDVLATDINPIAVRLCTDKGLRAQVLDITLSATHDLGRFDLAYADGLLGHLAVWPDRLEQFWRFAEDVVHPAGWILLSNDLADTDQRATTGVTHDKAAVFFRPPVRWYESNALEYGWRVHHSELYTYNRPERGQRRREILLLTRATDG